MQPGDIVAIMWPAGDHDIERAGTEQLVQVGNALGGRKKGTTTYGITVDPVDRETLLTLPTRAMRVLSPDTEAIELVQRSRNAKGDGDDGQHGGEDAVDPMRGSGRR